MGWQSFSQLSRAKHKHIQHEFDIERQKVPDYFFTNVDMLKHIFCYRPNNGTPLEIVPSTGLNRSAPTQVVSVVYMSLRFQICQGVETKKC